MTDASKRDCSDPDVKTAPARKSGQTDAGQETPVSDPGRTASVESAAEAGAGRRMPDHIRRHLIRLHDGKLYLPAAYRVVWFREECPDWAIITELLEGGFQAGWATVKATIMDSGGRIVSTGMKTESKADFPAGWVEKAETGSVGRALAMAGYGTQFAPDIEENGPSVPGRRSAHGRAPSNAAPLREGGKAGSETWPGPGQCPDCHAPEGKRHGKPCIR